MATTSSISRSNVDKKKSKKRSAVKHSASGLLSSILRRADIKTVSVDSMDASSLTVEEIAIGNSTVESIAISNIQTIVDIRKTFLNNVRTITNLDIKVRWKIRLLLYNDSGLFDVGSIPIPFRVGDVEIRNLDTISVGVPTAQVNETHVSIPPVTKLSFNGGVVKDVNVSDIQMPVNGYGLAGMAFDKFLLSHIGVPDAGFASVSIGSIEPNGRITLPSITVDDLGITDIQVPRVQSNSPISVANAQADVREFLLLELGFLRVSIVVKPSLNMNVESLTMEDIQASSSIDSISLQNIQFPFKASGVQMTGIEVSKLRAEGVSL